MKNQDSLEIKEILHLQYSNNFSRYFRDDLLSFEDKHGPNLKHILKQHQMHLVAHIIEVLSLNVTKLYQRIPLNQISMLDRHKLIHNFLKTI